ncbi:right-handed parallel beta-helix repeat-containing protein [Mucilaginibacter calamicampi]|uniref:Right-handed parallel beta-helix repeat-containing protein n=1 Tax=Mucilaginibacter calamicampi TaxID=1302352 RepID=A0ABW2YWD7_9SPHI
MRFILFSLKTLIICAVITVLTSFQGNKEVNIFVSPNGNDNNDGQINTPVRTIERAKGIVRVLRSRYTYSKITVALMPGEYEISESLVFTFNDGGTSTCSVNYKAYKPGTVTISGGKNLAHNWVKTKSGNIWKLSTGSYKEINQLFENGNRLNRSQSPLFYTSGPLRAYKGTIKDITKHELSDISEKFRLSAKLKTKDLIPFSGFSYIGNDLSKLSVEDVNNAEVKLYHSWDCSLHSIAKIDYNTKEVYLKSPSIYPVGFFSDRNRYVLENCREYLLKPGDWCYNRETNEILLRTKVNANPNFSQYTIPRLKQLILIRGKGDSTNRSVQNLTFSGIKFKYTVAQRGVHTDKKEVLSKYNISNIPWLDMQTGYSGGMNGDAAISLQNACGNKFENCDFSQLGASAINIKDYSSKNNIINCRFFDLGGGGIKIGAEVYDLGKTFDASLPTFNVVKKCKIHDSGLIYPSAIGIAVNAAIGSNINSNEIYNMPYDGILCGSVTGRGLSYTRANIIENNKIHHVMQLLADGGGIYTFGNQFDAVIRGNIVHDISRSPDATGSGNYGLYFDEGSARIFLDNNEVYNIENEAVRYNKSNLQSDIVWGTNKFDGKSITGSDGQLFSSVDVLQRWIKTGRLQSLISGELSSNWFIYCLIALLSIIIILFFKTKRRQNKKVYHKKRNYKVR